MPICPSPAYVTRTTGDEEAKLRGDTSSRKNVNPTGQGATNNQANQATTQQIDVLQNSILDISSKNN